MKRRIALATLLLLSALACHHNASVARLGGGEGESVITGNIRDRNGNDLPKPTGYAVLVGKGVRRQTPIASDREGYFDFRDVTPGRDYSVEVHLSNGITARKTIRAIAPDQRVFVIFDLPLETRPPCN